MSVAQLATGDQLRTEVPRGYPPHKIFRVGAGVRNADSFYVALQNNLIRLASTGENFPQIRRDFGVDSARDLYPAIMRRQIMRLLPFRGQVQKDWDYVKYLLYVRKALGDTSKIQPRHEAVTQLKINPEIGKRLDAMRSRVANENVEEDEIAVLACLFEVCVFVYDVQTKAYGGAMSSVICVQQCLQKQNIRSALDETCLLRARQTITILNLFLRQFLVCVRLKTKQKVQRCPSTGTGKIGSASLKCCTQWRHRYD